MDKTQKTMKVRVLVRVGESSKGGLTYTAAGWGDAKDGHGDRDMLRETVDTYAEEDWVDGGRYTWVTAEVPAPDVEATVEGTVDAGDCNACGEPMADGDSVDVPAGWAGDGEPPGRVHERCWEAM